MKQIDKKILEVAENIAAKHGTKAASKITGVHPSTIRNHCWKNGIPIPRITRHQTELDFELAALHAVAEPGEAMTLDEIAEWCGVSHEGIRRIEQKALRKIRKELIHLIRD